MESFEVLKKTIGAVGVKAVAGNLNLSASLVYKWCQPKGAAGEAGAGNPLDRIRKVYELTGDVAPIAWLCQCAGGFYVENPRGDCGHADMLKVTQTILKEFSELLDAVSMSVQNDGKIDPKEAEKIRREWEDLKTVAESFVLACEKGTYGAGGRPPRGNAP
ncbi:MAG: hypothetical protein JXR37_02290 [Kiritimatiellae bacterium]|nr:hypothetical protein [Kiritimatiellia bacterium]